MKRKRLQKGGISLEGTQWVLRYRVTVDDEKGTRRVQKYAVLGDASKRDIEARCRGEKVEPPRAVERERDKIINPLNQSIEVGKEIVFRTIRQFVEKIYFPDIKAPLPLGLKPSTCKGYDDIWNTHFDRRIGGHDLHEFKRHHAAELWNTIASANPDLTRQTFKNIRNFLSSVFRVAKDRGYYEDENPAKATLPRNLKESDEETYAYTPEEIDRIIFLLSAVPDAQAMVALAGRAGLRKGEIAALDWSSVTTNAEGHPCLLVARSFWEGHFGDPKTKKSTRLVPLHTSVSEILSSYRELCGKPQSGLMFKARESKKGNPLNMANVARRKIAPVLNRCAVCSQTQSSHAVDADHKFERDTKIPGWHGWHAFRRGIATSLREKGADMKDIGSILGHANEAVTDKHYAKQTEQRKLKTIRLLDNTNVQ